MAPTPYQVNTVGWDPNRGNLAGTIQIEMRMHRMANCGINEKQLEICQLNTLRWRLFSRAAVRSRAQGKPTLKLAVRG